MYISQTDSYSEIKKWLKVRKDYQDVKDVLEIIH